MLNAQTYIDINEVFYVSDECVCVGAGRGATIRARLSYCKMYTSAQTAVAQLVQCLESGALLPQSDVHLGVAQ